MYCFRMIHAGKHLKAREDPPCIKITDYVTNILWKKMDNFNYMKHMNSLHQFKSWGKHMGS